MFAAALLLAAFIVRELWSRRTPAPVEPETTATSPAALIPIRPPLPVPLKRVRTETSVRGVPSLKLTRIVPSKQKVVVVPLPK